MGVQELGHYIKIKRLKSLSKEWLTTFNFCTQNSHTHTHTHTHSSYIPLQSEQVKKKMTREKLESNASILLSIGYESTLG